MGKEIRVAIAGTGNCASSLVQGVEYYKNVGASDELVPGLMHNVFGGYKISDIKFVAAFDIDKRKVGKDLSEAIFAKPNNTTIFQPNVPKTGVIVQKAPVLDGFASHMEDYAEDHAFRLSNAAPVDVAKILKETKTDVLVSYVPVGSQQAAEYYAEACIKAGAGIVNCMPVFLASDSEWAKKLEKAKIPIVGDDIKSQVGATIVHRVLTKLFSDRGMKPKNTYQLNVGGNTDFLNMLERTRLKSKKISKTEAVQSQLPVKLPNDNIHIGPSDYVPFLKDNKVCFLRIEAEHFGGVPMELEARLSVEDSPNSAGIVIDALRACKLAKDRGIGGPITSVSAYLMKHPPQQFPDSVAKEMVEEFIKGERER